MPGQKHRWQPQWQAHLFDGPQGWADRLVAADLLTRQEAAP
jgi:2-haloacid dehalogenase